MTYASYNARPRGHRVTDELSAPLRRLQSLDPATKIALIILCAIGLWGAAILSFGVAALVWPMKVVVPGMIALLVLITWGQI